MRAFLVFLFFISSLTFAGDFEQQVADLEARQMDEEFKLGPAVKFAGKYPNEEYVLEYEKLKDKHLSEILSLHKEECKKNPKYCLSDADEKLKVMQTRIATELVSRKNQWAKESLPEEERNKKEEEYKAATNAELAEAEKKAKLAEAEKISSIPKSDKKVKQVEATPKSTANGKTATVAVTASSIDKERKEQLDQVKLALTALEDDYKKKFEGKEVTKEHLEAYKNLQNAKVNMTLAMYKNLCEKFPDDASACLKPEMVNYMKNGVENINCLMERKHQIHEAADKTKMESLEAIIASHTAQWQALNPKDCKTLLAADILPATNEEETATSTPTDADPSEESEDKRNYKSADCKWVVNMPRKIVSGPSCGKSKNNICVGYVSCPRKNGPGVFTRMSTCRASYCGNEDAVKCTQDPGYWSRKPTGEDQEYVSPEVKKVLKTSRQ